MADRKATNKYYPPDWDPSQGSINTYRGQHPLRDRARKLASEGILIVRFELPFNVVCGGCGGYLGAGTRYNAEKWQKEGEKYYSTPIWRFRMKCRRCPNYFVIKTDPKNSEYEIIEGARRREEDFDEKEIGLAFTGRVEEIEEMGQRKGNAMLRLDHEITGKKKIEKDQPFIDKLVRHQERTARDYYSVNSLLRSRFRKEKKSEKMIEEECKRLQEKAHVSIPILPASAEDQVEAEKMIFQVKTSTRKGPCVASHGSAKKSTPLKRLSERQGKLKRKEVAVSASLSPSLGVRLRKRNEGGSEKSGGNNAKEKSPVVVPSSSASRAASSAGTGLALIASYGDEEEEEEE
eukprot:Nk52_evm34s2152 gene=Nk52_evmTU34s2152